MQKILQKFFKNISINGFIIKNMKKVTEIGIDNVIKILNLKSDNNNYYNPQIEIRDKNKMSDFLNFCEVLSEYSYIDELGRTDSMQRKRTNLNLNDVVYKANTSIVCGIKIVKYPLFKLHEWEKWEDGYINIYARMDADEKFVEWFVWQYLKMDKLKIILKKFENELYLL